MSHHIRLGPFELMQPIGKGGMGEVWRGLHTAQNIEVAIKILLGPLARDKSSIEDFQNEVRAVAGLNHPGIVMVFDHGDITKEAETQSGGYFAAGSPYLAMEFASAGSMEKLAGTLSWPELRDVFLNLLDALAHAHARGVIHRDLKPANILQASEADARPGLKLTDFGIAHATHQHHTVTGSFQKTQGTPYYMAPEQCLGQWRDYGPWTDLYALGCVVYELICGHQPFEGKMFQIMDGHINTPPPPLKPLIEVPSGVEAWVQRLLQKSPFDRFVRAADAAWALINLDGSSTSEDSTGAPMTSLEATLSATGSGHGDGAPPTPSSWYRRLPPTIDMRLVGVGLGLYGLRSVGLVGRVPERDAIWDALKQVNDTSQPHMLYFDGGAGVGKSRLIEWMCERAHELGAATILHATHSPDGGADEGLSNMVAKHVRCTGLDYDTTLARARKRLEGVDDHEIRALSQFISPLPDDDPPSASERHALIRRLLERIGGERPVIVWLDDVQWAPDTLDFVASVFEATDPAPRPILFLLTARPEALAPDTPSGKGLGGLLKMPQSAHFPVHPLDGDEQTSLVKELLGLDGELTRQITQRTAGNPLFAVQIVGDWVNRGCLEVSESGFRLKAGETVDLPDNIHGVWCSHLMHLLSKHPSTAMVALELAAILGHAVDGDEWQQACAIGRIPAAEQILATLFTANLVVRTDNGWRFAHGLLRESLLRIARENNRHHHHHRACAAMLGAQPPVQGRHERIANHLLHAGEHKAALDPLYHSAIERKSSDEYHECFRLADIHDSTLTKTDAPDTDIRYARTDLLRAEVYRLQGHFALATRTLHKMFATAKRHNHLRFEALGLIEKGHLAMSKGKVSEAATLFEQAMGLFTKIKDSQGLAKAIDARGEVALTQGDLHRAQALHNHTLNIHQQQKDTEGFIKSSILLARVYGRAQAWEHAVTLYQNALVVCEQHNRRSDLAVIHSGLGDIHRFKGDLEAAETEYRQGLALQKIIGNEPDVLKGWVNLSLVLIALSQYDEAHESLAAVLERYKKLGWLRMVGMTHILMLPCLAFAEQWAQYEHHLNASVLIGEASISLDEANSVHNAAMIAALEDRQDMARRGFELALKWWGKLGRADKIAEIKAAL